MENEEYKKESEQFDKKLKDEDILSQFKTWYEESTDLYGLLNGIWKQNVEYYHGRQTDIDKIYGKQSKAVENRIFMATETMIPIATSRLPDVEVISLNPDELSQMNASALQDILLYQMERVGLQEKSELFIRDIIVKRYGVFKVLWDSERDDVGLMVVKPERVRFPKFGRSVDELKFIIEELEMSYDGLVAYFSEEKAKEILKNKYTSFDEQKIRKQNFLVYEVWTNDYTAWICGNYVIDTKDNPYFDYKETSKNYFAKARKPYIIKSLFHTNESIIGDTDYIQQNIPIQDNINIRKRQIENIASKVANPPLLIDSDVMSEEEAANITNEEGFILYGKDAASGTKIRFESPGNVPQYLFQDLEFSRNEFDNIWGVHSTTRGERQGKETLGGRQLLKQADLGRIDLVARQLERALDEIAEWFVQLIKLFYTDERSFSILGDDGVQFIQNFSNGKVGDIRLIVRPGSTLPKDEVTIHQEAKELWGLQAIGVRTLYKMLKLPNIQDAIDDYAKTKSGAILQQQGVPAQGMPTEPFQQIPEQGQQQSIL